MSITLLRKTSATGTSGLSRYHWRFGQGQADRPMTVVLMGRLLTKLSKPVSFLGMKCIRRNR